MGWWVNFRGADQMPGTCNERSVDLSVSATGCYRQPGIMTRRIGEQ